MPKAELFDREQVLAQAMRLFWEKGYHGTSIRDVEQATGLGKSSIYNSFIDKESLFAETLLYYTRNEQARQGEPLPPDTSPLAAIRHLFALVGNECASGRGCFMVNSITELANQQPRLHQLAVEAQTISLGLLRHLLEQAQQAGEVPATKDAADLALYLFAAIQGFKVTSMLASSPHELHPIVEHTLRSLVAPAQG